MSDAEQPEPNGVDPPQTESRGDSGRVAPPGLLRLMRRVPGVRGVATLLEATRFVVQGNSMLQSFASRQHLLIDRLAYSFSGPSRADVVVFRHPVLGQDHYLKRIVGLPGEHVDINDGRVLIDGHPLVEPYAKGATEPALARPSQWMLEDDQYFVMGDDRTASHDSRAFGPVQLHDIVGRAWMRVWPPGVLGRVG